LERFDNTLNDLEGELLKLRNTSEAYVKLQELSSSYKLILEEFQQNSSALKDFAQKQIAKHQEIKNSLVDISEENNKSYEQLKSLNNEIGKSLNSSIEELRNENRQFYLDFEKVVRIKLEENKSEIKQLIENERLRIKEMIDSKVDKQIEILNKNHKKTSNMILAFGIISILLLIGILIKQFI
jgi:predicted nucleic acid-binding Zn ribbon protein